MNYRRSILRFAVALLGISTACHLASAFEGRVEMTMTTEDGTMPMTYIVKGTKMRTEMVAQNDGEKPKRSKKKKKGEEAQSTEQAPRIRMVAIINGDTREMISYTENLDAKPSAQGDEEQPKFYFKMKMPEGDERAGKAAEAAEPMFKPTGKTDTIAGYKAEEYVSIAKKGERTEMWVTKELGRFMMANQGKQGKPGKAKSWEAFASKESMFPLRVISRPKEGAAEEFRMEVSKVEQAKVADSVFQVPEGYKPMPGLGDLMKGAIPNFGR